MTAPVQSAVPALRVTRDDLARHTWTWRTTGAMTAFIVVSCLAIPFVNDDVPGLRINLVALFFGLVSAHLLLSEPPSIGTPRNHAIVALPYLGAASLFWVSQTGGGLAVGAAMFIAPLASIRLDRWKQFAAHLGVATLLFALVGLVGGVDYAMRLCMLITVMAMWVLGFSCWVVLDMAEAQGLELERLVRRDPLTGIGNLRLLRERLEEELARHRRTGQELTVLALDLNGFKAINDELGHAAGDELLQSIGRGLDQVLGPEETVVRQGGDEFCILLPETSAALAVRTMNAVRAVVAGAGVEGVTTGIGVATFPGDADRGDVLLHVADERLRTDKGDRARAARDAASDQAATGADELPAAQTSQP